VKVLPEPADALYILKGALFIRTSLRILDKKTDYERFKIKNKIKPHLGFSEIDIIKKRINFFFRLTGGLFGVIFD
jgi:hypothetical protein